MSGLPFDFPKTESRYLAKVRVVTCAIRRRFGAEVPATDIVHDVMLAALAEQTRPGIQPKGFWRRLVNKVFDNYRREQVHRRMIERRAATMRDEERWSTGGKAGEDEAIGRELRGEIWRSVAELSETDQEIWRRLGESQSYAEIAEALGKGKTPEAVKQAAYRIRAHVRNRLPTEYQKEVKNDG